VKLAAILPHYSDENLSQLAHDKLEDVMQVRLPRTVLEKEIAAALSSFSYISDVLASSQPPTYAFLKLLMETPGHTVAAVGFREAVMSRTDRLTEQAAAGTGLDPRKNLSLYLAVLAAAWSSDRRVNVSEANLLAALRAELNLNMREHLLLEHHPDIREFWSTPRAYANARNHLLARGLVLTDEDRFVLPDEVRFQVRRHWDMELHDSDYRELLTMFTHADLRSVLQEAGLALSGSKDERIERIIDGLIPPSTALGSRTIDDLKQLSRELRLQVSLPKQALIDQLIQHIDTSGRQPDVPEARRDSALTGDERQNAEALLQKLSNNQLYELLDTAGLRRSGTKVERIERLLDSGFAMPHLVSALPRRELVQLCRATGLQTSGPKDELIIRLLESGMSPDEEAAEDEQTVGELPQPMEAEPIARSGRPAKPRLSDIRGLTDMQHDYPALTSAEQAVMALLRDARSLNERDLQRLTVRYGLNWSLPKAHMSELIHKLATTGHNPIRIRSTGSANVYEWIEGVGDGQQSSAKWAARDVMEALRQGVVPERGVETLFIGQDQARTHFTEQLKYIATGRSAFKFVKGAYGSGKTFFLAWLRNHALDNGFAISAVRVSAEMTMGNLSVLYKAIMDGLRSPEKRGASSIADLLETWLLEIQRKVAHIEGLSADDPLQQKKLSEHVHARIRSELAAVAAHDPGLATALSAFYDARLAGNDSQALTALAYIRGDTSVSAAALRQINVRGNLEPEQVLVRLRAILEIIAASQLNGLVILIDELELVRRRPHRHTRDQAYETLRALIDEAGENRLHGCLIVCTGTEELFSDERHGLPSYQALANRIDAPRLGEGYRSVRQPVIELDGLDAARLRNVALKAREIHATAYDWPAAARVTDSDIDFLIDEWTQFGGERIDRLPRPFLRQLVHTLDLCEENPELTARDSFGDPQQDQEAADAIHAAVY